jgi:hypothetical protein
VSCPLRCKSVPQPPRLLPGPLASVPMSAKQRSVSRFTARLLVVLLPIVFAGADALHWVPGCGHGAEVGGHVFWLGISPEKPTDSRGDQQQSAQGAGQELLVYDEAECSICSAAGEDGTQDGAPSALLSVHLVHILPESARCDAVAQAPRLTLPRAPPLA